MPKYGEKLYGRSYLYRVHGLTTMCFRYRMDPVPFSGKRTRYRWKHWYQNFRVRKFERSLWEDHKDYVRGKRSPKALPSPWDDYQRGDVSTRKSWKSKKVKKQWQKNLLRI